MAPTAPYNLVAIKTYLRDGLAMDDILSLVPGVSKSTVYRHRRNLDAFRQLTVPYEI